jgi:hypothetical protein
MLFSLRKGGNSDTCYNVNESRHDAKWNKLVLKRQTVFASVESSQTHKGKVEWWLPKAGDKEREELVFND